MKLTSFLSRLKGRTAKPLEDMTPSYEMWTHDNTHYTFLLPPQLTALEPLLDLNRSKAKSVQAWWSKVHDSVRPPFTHFTIFTVLDTEKYARTDPGWIAEVRRGKDQFITGAGYAFSDDISVPGGEGVWFTSRHEYDNEARVSLQTVGPGGIIHLSMVGQADSYEMLVSQAPDIFAGIKLKDSFSL